MFNRRSKKRRLSPLALGIALLLHAALAGVMFVRIDSAVKPLVVAPPEAPVDIVEAITVDAAAIEAEAARKEAIEQERLRRIEEEKRRAEEVERQRIAEQKRIEEEKRRQAEAEKQAAEEKKRKEEAAKKKAAEEKKRKEAEAKKKAAEEKKRKEEAARKKAEAEKKRKAEEAERKAREAALQAEMAAEARARRASAALSQYVPQIQRKVEDNWILPPGGAAGCTPTVRLTLGPDGRVLNARIVKSSGDSYCDRSVEQAFLRASPIPIPPDPDLYAEFKEIDFVFNPR